MVRGLHQPRGGAPGGAGGGTPNVLRGTLLATKYRIQRSIGAGGMGEVFEADDLVLRRKVAIKVVVNPTSKEALVRLVREAQLVSAMQHPNICAIYEVGALESGAPFLVLERLRGETLASRLRRGPLPYRVAIDLMIQILSGIDAAHRASIVHRDLKPENVFLSERLGLPPHVKILDFGFAKDLSGQRAGQLTRPGVAVGTPRYMSPEQLLGKGADPRTDIFAVGLVFFETLTGKHPFEAATIPMLNVNVVRGNPTKLSKLRPDLRWLEPVFERALARNRADRYPSAPAMLKALVQALPDEVGDDETTRVRLDSAPERGGSGPQRLPRLGGSTNSSS
jgi:serine/threonine protein kinase